MTSSAGVAVLALVLIVAATVLVSAYGQRFARTTSDLLVASRTVGPVTNAAAIGGEYLSAASFLGIAGLVLAYGADMLWYPVGYTTGYLVLLLLVAAPLRRSGAYTLPDFAEARLRSSRVRTVATLLVVLISWLYLLPQLQGAGLVLRLLTGAPAWVGALVVIVVVSGNVAAGGMRSITVTQAFQYWLKLTAISVPAVVLLLSWRAAGAPALDQPVLPVLPQATTVTLRADATLTLREPVAVTASGRVDERPVDGALTLAAGEHGVRRGTVVTFPAGTPLPAVGQLAPSTDRTWSLPLSGAGGREHPLYATYSLVLATFLGTMGLPHVLVRFYTNPDGGAARRTTLVVLMLLGAFYLAPAVYGALGRLYAPDLLLTGQADAVVLVLPTRLLPGAAGTALTGLLTAGAFAAFLSTSSGLVVSVAGTISQDLLGGSVRGFRLAALLAGVVPLVLSTSVTRLGASVVVGLAFAVAASSFCPLLLLGIWWRGLTAAGAICGLVVGGGLAVAAVLVTIVGASGRGWPAVLLAQPAALTVPIAFAVMVGVSLATRHSVPPDVARTMRLLHAPESLDRLRTVQPAERTVRSPGGDRSGPRGTVHR